MAKKKQQTNEAVQIAEAIDWIKGVLKDDPIANANDLIREPLGERQKELSDELVEKILESGKPNSNKAKAVKRERPSAQEPPTNSGAALTDTKNRF